MEIPGLSATTETTTEVKKRTVDVWITRRGRKSKMIIEGLDQYREVFPENKDIEKMMTDLQKKWVCAANVVKQSRHAKLKITFKRPESFIIQFQGDHFRELAQLLVESGIPAKEIMRHGV